MAISLREGNFSHSFLSSHETHKNLQVDKIRRLDPEALALSAGGAPDYFEPPVDVRLSPEEWIALQSQIYNAMSAVTWSFSHERDVELRRQHERRFYDEEDSSDEDEDFTGITISIEDEE